jgi:hypothetical protein
MRFTQEGVGKEAVRFKTATSHDISITRRSCLGWCEEGTIVRTGRDAGAKEWRPLGKF